MLMDEDIFEALRTEPDRSADLAPAAMAVNLSPLNTQLKSTVFDVVEGKETETS